MEQAARKLLASRLRSVGFVASAWLAAVKTLFAVLKDRSGVRLDSSVKWYGKPKGSAIPARGGWNPLATIINSISKGGTRVNAIITAGAQEALDKEAKSMDEYVMRKLAPHHEKFNKA